mmetsp:Transcript_12861/g.37762  ORF Transcript_12861/g.37762 Transcript_12861/m.37762 type:complete len:276 (+) Transcript_12861:777-1604(+)
MHDDLDLVGARPDPLPQRIGLSAHGGDVRAVGRAGLEHGGRVDRLRAGEGAVHPDGDAVARVHLEAHVGVGAGGVEGAPVEGDAAVEAVVERVPLLGFFNVDLTPPQRVPLKVRPLPRRHRHLQRGGGRRRHTHCERAERVHRRGRARRLQRAAAGRRGGDGGGARRRGRARALHARVAGLRVRAVAALGRGAHGAPGPAAAVGPERARLQRRAVARGHGAGRGARAREDTPLRRFFPRQLLGPGGALKGAGDAQARGRRQHGHLLPARRRHAHR